MPSVTGSPTTMKRMTIASIFSSSVRRAPQRLDLVAQPVAFIGDDAFDPREAILHRTQFGAQLGIFLADQLDAFHRFVAGLGIDRLAPAVFERIAVLDAQPGGENPSADPGQADNRGDGGDGVQDIQIHYRLSSQRRRSIWLASCAA